MVGEGGYVLARKIDCSEREWEKIRIEYVTSSISYRSLADKYNLSYNRVQTRAKENGWAKEREEYKEKLLKKSLDLVLEQQANRIAEAVRLGDKMLEKVSEALDNIDVMLCKKSTTVKSTDENGDEVSKYNETFRKKKVIIDKQGLKQLSGVLKDLKEIGIFRAELDRREQEARIEKLRKECDSDKDKDIKVVIECQDYAE